MPSVGGMPTLAQVRGWGTAHLTEAATQWTATATLWEDAFTEVASQMNHPGGAPWEGVAAEAAQHRAYTDRLKVVGLADQLHEAAQIACTGATQIDEARRLVLRTVQSAESAGFTVGEDFSVTDPRLYDAGTAAIRQAQAETFAADLRAGVGALVATDSGVAGQLTAATAGLGSATFPESGDAATGVQLVDYKKSPPTPADPDKDPYAQNPDYPNRNNLGHYGAGNSKDGKAEEQAALDFREDETGISIERQQVRATHPDVTKPDGKPQWRYYDGLEPTGNPDEYIGIEAKGHPGAHQPYQDAFDAAVTDESPAEAVLNGRKIKIVDTAPSYPPPGWTPPDTGGTGAQQAPTISGLPQWLQGAPTQVGPHNPLLAPFPGASMPGMPTSPVTGGLPDSGLHLPHIDLPSPKDCATGVLIAGTSALLLLLAPLGVAGG